MGGCLIRPSRLAALVLVALTLTPLAALAAPESLRAMAGSLPQSLGTPSVVWDGQRYAYVLGGYNNNGDSGVVARYDPAADVSTRMPVNLTPPRSHAAAVWDPRVTSDCPAGCAYVLGGSESWTPTDTIVRYDPARQVLVELPVRLPCTLVWESAVFDGRYAYLFGGVSSCPEQIVRFDPVAGAVAVMRAHLPQDVYGASAVFDDRHGVAYVLGGRLVSSSGGKEDRVDIIVRYDPATDTTTTMQARLPTPRYQTAAAFDGSRAFVLGGVAPNATHAGSAYSASLSDVAWFDPANDTVGLAGVALPASRYDAGAVWVDGAAYAMGGVACQYSGNSFPACRVRGDVLRYQPATIDVTTAPEGNGSADAPPVADLALVVDDLNVTADGRASRDPDGGAIASWSWDWGDGATTTGATSAHAYAAGGTYVVTLVVTDNASLNASATRTVAVASTTSVPASPFADAPPVASFAAHAQDLSVSVDASDSTDPDGRVVAYGWDWGDGSAGGSGKTATHAYAKPGAFTVRLTVRDEAGASASAERVVEATPPSPRSSTPEPVATAAAAPKGNVTSTPAATTHGVPGAWPLLALIALAAACWTRRRRYP